MGRAWRPLVVLALLAACAACAAAQDVHDAALAARIGTTDGDPLASFMQWFAQNGGVAKKVKIADVAGGGRGLVATEPIEAGEVIVEVPAALFLNCEKHPVLFWIPTSIPERGQFCLAVRLLQELNDPASRWAPYLRLLPSEPGQLWDFDEDEIAALHSPHANEAIRLRNETTHTVYTEVVLPLTEKLPAHYPAEKFTFERFRWAVSISYSRSWATYGMVPFLDMANHDGIKGGRLHVDVAQESPAREAAPGEPAPPPPGQAWVRGTLKAEVACQPGDQVFVTYGSEKAVADFLINYGFIPPYEDTVSVLRLGIEPKATSSPGLLAALKVMEGRGVGVGTPSGGRQMLAYVREGTVPKLMLEFLRLASYEGPAEPSPPPGYIGLENERRALQGLRQQLLVMLDAVPSTAEADAAEAERLEAEAALFPAGHPAAAKARRRALVVRARMHETRIRRSIVQLSETLWLRMLIAENPADVTR